MKYREQTLPLADRHLGPPRRAGEQPRSAQASPARASPRDRADAANDAGAIEYASWLRLLRQRRP